jgi:hypothetical protein
MQPLTGYGTVANMVTLLPIEPLSEAHGMLIVEAFNELFINGGGKEDGYGCGYGDGDGNGDGNGNAYGYGYGGGNTYGSGGAKCPEEWRVGP